MSVIDKVSFEKRKLQELVREYSKLGYEVYAEYGGYPRPDHIGDFVPDLILKKGNMMIIVEIATKRDLKNLSEKTEQFAKYAEQHEGVRFDLVLTNPKPRLSQEEKEISNKILLEDVQKRLLEDAKELFQTGYYEASFLMLSILLENVLKELSINARASDIHEKMSNVQNIHLLHKRGIISENNYASLRRFYDYRNRVLHECYRPTKQILREYIEFVSHFAHARGRGI